MFVCGENALTVTPLSKRRGLVYVCIVFIIDSFTYNLDIYIYTYYILLYTDILELHPVSVTTRTIFFLVGNPCKPSFVALTGWQVDQTFIYPKCTKTEPANVFHSFMMSAILSPGSFGINPLLLGVVHHKNAGWTSTATDMQDLMDGCCCCCCCCGCGCGCCCCCCCERKTGGQCYPWNPCMV